ncbi:hypothetical protein [Mucilaginibacter panaciglaebae]|uniref:hypothetical protein n=1 Tax=Mucilaginibacter panaciglaebae TaxID=502331 RepID=UPI0031E551DD
MKLLSILLIFSAITFLPFRKDITQQNTLPVTDTPSRPVKFGFGRVATGRQRII